MPKFNPKQTDPVDVLIIGDHPSAYLVGALLRQKATVRVVQVGTTDQEPADRLCTLNPAIFELDPLLTRLKQSLNTTATYGLRFLADKSELASEHRTKSSLVSVAKYSQVRDQLAKLTEPLGVEQLANQPLQIHSVDEQGLRVTVGKHSLYPKAMIVAGELTASQKSLLGMPESWGPDVVHRFTMVRCKIGKHFQPESKALLPMSLDLCGNLCWGWLLPGDGEFQLIVEQPVEQATPGSGIKLLDHWVAVLKSHQVLGQKFEYSPASVYTADRPLAGALAQEGVANRTLLIGPAGGFYSACGEEMYPACWSALFAAEVMKKAMKEKHLQDALNPYRLKWRTTLGDYLRGPHQNLRFLLPLVYRNPAMAARLTEAILLSKSVVR